jgi:hypothetical protein
MPHEYDSAFMTGDEVATMSDLFDGDPNFLPYSENGAFSRCHKGKPKGVSYDMCT